MFSDSFLTELKYRCDTEQIIGSYVQLKRHGKNMTGLCPFHSEKTPSFTVYTENQSFYCFGCGASGSVINFIMKIENLDFAEAVRFLAAKVGMEVPEDDDNHTGITAKRVLEANREAAKFYHQLLMSEAGKPGRAYLVERGLQKNTVVHFGLGYAPNEWNKLTDYLRSKGFSDQEMVTAGLASKSSKGNVFDFFRGRVMFPVIDLRGNVVAFSGRTIIGDDRKYLNTGETPAFKKSRHLFGLNFAKNSEKEGFIVVEGNMDVVSLHQAGFDNTVASLGTAMTPDHARIIKQYRDKVFLSYDSDEPGQKATRRASAIFEDVGITAQVISIPDAKDPDEYIKKHGADYFQLLLDGSKNATEFEMANIKRKYNLDTDEGKAGCLQDLVRMLAGLTSPIEQDIYLGRISKEMYVSVEALKSQLTIEKRKLKSAEHKKEISSTRVYTMDPNIVKNDREKALYPKYVRAEEGILAILYSNPEKWPLVAQEVRPEEMVSKLDQEIYREMLTRYEENRPVDAFSISGSISPQASEKLGSILAETNTVPAKPDYLNEYIQTLKSFQDVIDQKPIEEKTDAELLANIEKKRNKG